jgi:glutamyl-tRNA synthetase
MIYKALNLPIPTFAHLPMILGSDKKRLSKRHGATGVQEYRNNGYLAESMINYLALLGWNPGTEQEIFSMNELVEQFSIGRVQKKSAVFDDKKLHWLNGQHIQKLSSKDILNKIKEVNSEWKSEIEDEYLLKVIDLMKERVKTLNEMQTNTEYFFYDPADYDEKAAKKKWKNDSVNELIEKYTSELSKIEKWTVENIENTLRKLADHKEISPGKIIHPTRLAVSGTSSGPSLFDMMELLGKDTCIRRLETALEKLPLT